MSAGACATMPTMKRTGLGMLAVMIGCGGAAATKPNGWNVGQVTYCGECDGYNKITIPVEATPPDADIGLLELVTVTCEPGSQPLGFQPGAFTVTTTARAAGATVPGFDGGELVLDECTVGRVRGSFRLDRTGQPSIGGAFDVAPFVTTHE